MSVQEIQYLIALCNLDSRPETAEMGFTIASRLKVFLYKDEPYIKIIPAKRLFNSTTIHEVVTRGDFFAVNMATNVFTVLPQGADSEQFRNKVNKT